MRGHRCSEQPRVAVNDDVDRHPFQQLDQWSLRAEGLEESRLRQRFEPEAPVLESGCPYVMFSSYKLDHVAAFDLGATLDGC